MINKVISKKSNIISFEFLLWAILVGGLCFILTYGITSLNVTNINWLLRGDDLNQHYIGWKFYRRSSWKFPIGLITGITQDPISIIYTDSIPLFAILFKILSPILPTKFQYFGIWGIICYILQAYFSMILLKKYMKEKPLVIMGSIFFTLSPILLRRMFIHSALGGNWLILAALCGWVYKKSIKGYRSNIIIWSALMVLAVTIHMYYIPMILAIMCSCFLDLILSVRDKKIVVISITAISISIISALITMYMLGAFYGEPGVIQGGLRQFSANLNTFYNSQGTSLFLKGYPLVSSTQGEGYGYLGLGTMTLFTLGIIGQLFSRKKFEKEEKISLMCLLILIIVLGGYALSPCITWNSKILIDIPWPKVIIGVFSIFRVTGRFIWPIYYIIISVAVILIIKIYSRKIAYVLLIAGIILQIADISPLIKNANMRVDTEILPSTIQSDAWKELKENFNKIEFITSYSKVGDTNMIITDFFSMKNIFDIADYACDNQMVLNDFYIGRRNGNHIETEKYNSWCGLLEGRVNEQTIYIFNKVPYILAENSAINIYKLDGLIIGISKKYNWINEPSDRVVITEPINIINNSLYIINGEDINGKRILYPNGISYGPYDIVDKGRYKVIAEGENLNQGNFDVHSLEKNIFFSISNYKDSSNYVSFDIELTEPVFDIEYRITNQQNNNIIIKKFVVEKYGGDN